LADGGGGKEKKEKGEKKRNGEQCPRCLFPRSVVSCSTPIPEKREKGGKKEGKKKTKTQTQAIKSILSIKYL